MSDPVDRKRNLPPVETRFKPGQSGNPGGRPVGARNALQTRFLKALAKDFDEHGEEAIKDARERDPVRYVQIVAALMPKQVEQTTPFEDVSDAELIAGIALLRARLAESTGAGAAAAPEPTQTH